MIPEAFKAWRKSLGLSQRKAADALGLKSRIVQYYENGERNGAKVKIPKHVRLACFALSTGIVDYQGPAEKLPADEAGIDARGHRKAKKARRAAIAPSGRPMARDGKVTS